jgi:hypothetical protein
LAVALVLMVVSALVGTATGLVFRIWTLVLISPVITIFSAIVLRSFGFGLVAGVSIVAGCLAVCQLAFLAAGYLLHAQGISAHDEIDGQPGEDGQQKIRRQHK